MVNANREKEIKLEVANEITSFRCPARQLTMVENFFTSGSSRAREAGALQVAVDGHLLANDVNIAVFRVGDPLRRHHTRPKYHFQSGEYTGRGTGHGSLAGEPIHDLDGGSESDARHGGVVALANRDSPLLGPDTAARRRNPKAGAARGCAPAAEAAAAAVPAAATTTRV